MSLLLLDEDLALSVRNHMKPPSACCTPYTLRELSPSPNPIYLYICPYVVATDNPTSNTISVNKRLITIPISTSGTKVVRIRRIVKS